MASCHDIWLSPVRGRVAAQWLDAPRCDGYRARGCPVTGDRVAWHPFYWTAHKGGSCSHSAPALGACVADLLDRSAWVFHKNLCFLGVFQVITPRFWAETTVQTPRVRKEQVATYKYRRLVRCGKTIRIASAVRGCQPLRCGPPGDTPGPLRLRRRLGAVRFPSGPSGRPERSGRRRRGIRRAGRQTEPPSRSQAEYVRRFTVAKRDTGNSACEY